MYNVRRHPREPMNNSPRQKKGLSSQTKEFIEATEGFRRRKHKGDTISQVIRVADTRRPSHLVDCSPQRKQRQLIYDECPALTILDLEYKYVALSMFQSDIENLKN
jgi:hypothetical protein